MELFEAVSRRFCYRAKFSGRVPSKDDLLQIIQAGVMAPSGCNRQTTSFVIVDDPGLVKQIGSMHQMPAMQTAAALIACIVDRHPEAAYEGYSFAVEDCSAAVQNMLLAITALGYASVWIDGWLRLQGRAEIIGNLLGVPNTKVIRVLLPIGCPAEEYPRKEKKPLNERAWFNRYNS